MANTKKDYTAACRNSIMGSSGLQFCGRFSSLDEAEAYCRHQNLLTRDFCTHEVWEGTPDVPRKLVKVVKRD